MTQILLNKEEALIKYNQLVDVRFPTIAAFLFFILILKIFFQVNFPNILFFLVSFLLLSVVVYDILFKRIKEPKTPQIINGYFIYMLFDVIVLTIIIYIIGGVTWIGFIFYALYIYVGFLLFPKAYSMFFVFYCSFLYTLLVIVQYLGIFPYQAIFSVEERIPQNFYFIFTTWSASMIFLLVLGYYGATLYGFLHKKIEELQKTKMILEEERASLEIRVRARTKELFEERKGLEQKVHERTKELEKKGSELARRVVELEKFHKAAVGRELKMRELKKEIERMQTEFEKYPQGA